MTPQEQRQRELAQLQRRRINHLTEMAHRRELKRAGFTMATTGNYGWVGSDTGWASKTSRGILETWRTGPGHYAHRWSE